MTTAEAKLMRKRLVSAYLSSIFSTSLVLLLIGIASLLAINAGTVTDYFKENMAISVIFKYDVQEKQAENYCNALSTRPYAHSVEYVSREQGIAEMNELLGEDFLSVFETAPIPLSINLTLNAEYFVPERLDSVTRTISAEPLIDEVVCPMSVVNTLNTNLTTVTLVLSVFIVLLLFISFVLIGNSIRLNLFSKRFTIHTMRLVGATRAFICKPFIIEAVFQGVIASQVAIILLLALLLFVKREFALLFTILRMEQLLVIIGIMLVSGLVICVVSTFAAVCRMVSLRREELYI